MVAGYNPGNGAGTLVGVIGGYEDGGRYPWASYSAYFGSALRAVFMMAELRSAPSPEATAPSPGPAAARDSTAAGFYGLTASADRAQRTLVPYISPSGSARSSRRTPSGSLK